MCVHVCVRVSPIHVHNERQGKRKKKKKKTTPKRIVSPCQKDIQSKSVVHLTHIPQHTLQLCYYLPDIRNIESL